MNTAFRAASAAHPGIAVLARAALVAALAVSVTGCGLLGGGGGGRERATIYAPDVRVAPDPSWPRVDWQLAIGSAAASRVTDSPRINVRPTPSELEVYAGAAWAQPATDMLEDTLLRAFEDSGRIDAVARSESGIRSDYKLVLDLRRFESDYAGAAVPSATIEVAAKLLYNRDQRVAASRTFLQAVPAGGTDVGAVVAAFERGLAALTADMVGWTLSSGNADAAGTAAVPASRRAPPAN
ncbi:membrane integrity-associated transporter subunit PqiC [Luteimonas sp. SJ-92]|uniref:Membrane integrity-associated transporter subunit PqiC n=1 Tax=Luteimonas salinisoli TaxID=2752307 RepID=A0A853JCS2_9GAMM|nr:ABC-type transport auxiliary lipoprotein family protein [Luteimonas salinisoli]NZA27073.1 membrane integrity-associated transporter subunit PqiC [Luteimonas salinisoli]